MVIRNKLYKVIDRYIKLLTDRKNKTDNKLTLKSSGGKLKVIAFFKTTGRWPTRKSKSKQERKLASCFENYISKKNRCYDSNFRRLVMASGFRSTNNKRKHNVKGFKIEILEFIEMHGRVPSRLGNIEGENNLHYKLNYYTNKKKDMAFLGKVYKGDKCHRSGILGKYRSIINEALDIDKPLIRLV